MTTLEQIVLYGLLGALVMVDALQWLRARHTTRLLERARRLLRSDEAIAAHALEIAARATKAGRGDRFIVEQTKALRRLLAAREEEAQALQKEGR